MKIPKLKQGESIEIIWRDTHFTESWFTKDEFKRWFAQNDGIVRTSGLYMAKNDKFIALVGSVSGESVLNPIKIPLCGIQKVNKLEGK